MRRNLYLMNSPIMPNTGIYMYETIDVRKFKDYFNIYKNLYGYDVVSAIGHEATAKLLTELLYYEVPVNRISVEFQDRDVALVVKLKQRLEEGKVLNKEELDEMIKSGMIEFGFVEYRAVVSR
jgi:hypothetical protein